MAMVETTVLTVKGMHCSGCEQRVSRGLEQLPGVKVLRADRALNEVQVRVNTSQASYDQIRQRIEAMGFEMAG